MKFATQAVHEGVYKDDTFNSVTTPIYPSSNFFFDKIGKHRGFDYTRSGNPTRRALEENLARLEGGAGAVCTCTGMAAVTAVMHLLKCHDHILTGKDIYGGSYRLLSKVFVQFGLEVDFIDMRDLPAVKNHLKENTRLVLIETPSNPLLNIIDIQQVTRIVNEYNSSKSDHSQDILTAVDNTFMSPYCQKPLELGADIIIQSTTKYINGHSDVVGGAVISRTQEIHDRIAFIVNALGISESPFDTWLVLRGVKTLPLRMEKHSQNAEAIAGFLNEHTNVEKVYYPGLKDHPEHEIALKQMKGFGGMLSFDIKEGAVSLDDFFNKLKLFKLAESLGGVESLIEAPYYMSHASMEEKERQEAGIKKMNVRLSAGIEEAEDLIADLDQALSS